MASDDATAQSEELVVLQSVYADDEFITLDDSYLIKINVVSPNPNLSPLLLKFSYPSSYPSKVHPVFTISGEWLEKSQISTLQQKLVSQFIPGEVTMFQWADWLRENTVSVLGMEEKLKVSASTTSQEKEDVLEPVVEDADEIDPNYVPDPEVPTIYHGIPVTDRKSKFQAHLAVVHSVEDAESVITELLKDKKIANATHNISAYRIIGTNGVKHENRDDDGETGAGDKLLYLLDKSNYVNIVVVVTRWFGGIQLGADRFKHITGVAKELLEDKYKTISEEEVNGYKGGKFRPAEDVYNRIKWDTDLDKDEFIIGYEDRFAGDMEIPFSEFGSTDVPFHRIRYYKKGDEVLWDRRKKIDNFFV